MAFVFADTMMRGNGYVRQTVGNYLENNLGFYIDTLRYQNSDLTGGLLLPYPSQFMASDPLDTGNHSYPIVGTYFPNSREFNSDVTYLMSGSTEYTITYDAVVFVTVATPYVGQDEANLPMYATPSRDATIKCRDDLMGCVRAAVLGKPSFGTAGTDRTVVANVESFTETYPEPMQSGIKGSDRWICSGLLNLSVKVTERVAAPMIDDGTGNIATLQHVNLDVSELPFD